MQSNSLHGTQTPPPPEECPKPELSPQAEKIIESLRKKPVLLAEVAAHFAHGWPIDDLAGPWVGERLAPGSPFAKLIRRFYADTTANPAAEIRALRDKGHAGDQWVASLHVADTPVDTRVFNDPISAGAWADKTLTAADIVLMGDPISKEDLDEMAARELAWHEQKVAKEAAVQREYDDAMSY